MRWSGSRAGWNWHDRQRAMAGSMSGLDWLIARPVAHRGLHDAGAGVIENTPSAFAASVAANYAIECDLQISADGEAMVHHDDALGRLTDGSGRLEEMPPPDPTHTAFNPPPHRSTSSSTFST